MQVTSSNDSPFADIWATASAASTGVKTYRSIADMNDTLIAHGQQYTQEYAAEYAASKDGGAWSTDQVLNSLKSEFPTYDIVSSDPKNVVRGRNLLYIDSTNLSKMAKDPNYRARVMGLIKRESEGMSGARFNQGDQTFTFRPTGPTFSLSETNPTVDGIPYLGSAESEGFSTTTTSSGGASDPIFASGETSPRRTLKKLLEEAIAKRQAKRAEEEKQAAETSSGSGPADKQVDILV